MEDSMKPGLKIKAMTVQNGDFAYRTFRLSGWKANGERVRRQFQSREEAEGEKSRLVVEAANAASGTRTLNTRLTSAQLAEAETAFARLGDKSLTLAVQWLLDTY